MRSTVRLGRSVKLAGPPDVLASARTTAVASINRFCAGLRPAMRRNAADATDAATAMNVAPMASIAQIATSVLHLDHTADHDHSDDLQHGGGDQHLHAQRLGE